ncbi:uncharacterized protein C8orf48 homolog isoform X2 [Lethenteron reissneri]|uniref:uncharacterized protein C8orf48 homolog isoform X2 n=1 Tax=Lethenteron reissneri TaxID=7753 RepID=UPI002AB66D5B|nr:uncharacterized protein C8orf48 homolog isoform X2 [Lethenteron reissneri]
MANTGSDAALSAFCRRSVERVRRESQGPRGNETPRGVTWTPRGDPEEEETPIPEVLLQRLRLATMADDVRQASTLQLHVPASCSACRDAAAALARQDFVRRRWSQLQERRLQWEIEGHLYTKDSLSLIGVIHEGLPRPSAPPEVIWGQLKSRESSRRDLKDNPDRETPRERRDPQREERPPEIDPRYRPPKQDPREPS